MSDRLMVIDGAGTTGDELGLPPEFDPALPWVAFVYATQDGPLGLEHSGVLQANLVTHLILPAIEVRPATGAGGARVLLPPAAATLRIGGQVWIPGPLGYLTAVEAGLARRERAARNQALAARYGRRSSSSIPRTGVDRILSELPACRWTPTDLPRSAEDQPSELWVAFRSSLGGMLVGVGRRHADLRSIVEEAVRPLPVALEWLSDARSLPAW